jgi:hypothetical protein
MAPPGPAMTLVFVVDLLDHPAKIELARQPLFPLAADDAVTDRRLCENP